MEDDREIADGSHRFSIDIVTDVVTTPENLAHLWKQPSTSCP